MTTALKGSATTRYRVPSVERAFEIIRLLERSSLGLTKAAIAKKLQLPYSSVFNLLNTLVDFNYARQDSETGRYFLGSRLAAVDHFESRVAALRHAASPLMRGLIENSFFTSHLAILRDGEAIYVEKHEPLGFFKLNTWVGQRVYVHSTAVGKALIAYQPKTEIQELWKRGLPRRTDRTITSIRRLWSELSETRKRGYAIDDQEDQIGGRCLAAPVFLSNGSVVAALGVSAMAAHLPVERVPDLAKAVLAAAKQVSESLGAEAG